MTDTIDSNTDSEKEFDLGKWKEMIDKLGNNSFNFRNGLPTLNSDEIKPEWNDQLSDWLFCVGGVSMFFSSLCYRAKYHWTWAIPTAGAWVHGGKLHIAFNPYFMMECLPELGHRVFVLLHEVSHLIHDHTIRCKEQSLDPQLWNQACDFYINFQLERFAKHVPDNKKNLIRFVEPEVFPLCFDEKYEDWTEREIYDDLLKQAKQQSKDKKSGDGSGEGDGSEQGQGNGGQKALDDFSDYGDQSGGDDMGSARNTIYKSIREAETAMKNSGKKPGSHEMDLIRNIIASTEVKVDWKDALGEYVVQNSDELITYNKVSRRNTANIIFPVRTGDSIRMFFGIDTSGSMTMPELEDASGGVRQIAELFSNYHITAASADTNAHYLGCVDTLEGVEDFDVRNIEIRGGGGTKMSPLISMAHEISETEGQEFDVIVVFTDGELMDGDIDDVNDGDIPVIVLVTEQGTIPNVKSAEKIIQLN